MEKKTIATICVSLSCLFFSSFGHAEVQDYLLLQDIESYKFITQRRHQLTKKLITVQGYTERGGPGILGATGHFSLDHQDTTYETDYESEVTDLGMDIQVTQHAGSDSDQWFLHEVERGFRGPDVLDAAPAEHTSIRTINGNKIFFHGAGIIGYRWLSNNVFVNIQYSVLSGDKPEPLEVIQAYLAKHPSTITLSNAEFQSNAHDEQWIKDEMARRLWLSDRWFLQIQTGKATQDEVLRETADHLRTFLDYREKYFGVDAFDEKEALSEFLFSKNGTGIKNKLTEYKAWWEVNKNKAIVLE